MKKEEEIDQAIKDLIDKLGSGEVPHKFVAEWETLKEASSAIRKKLEEVEKKQVEDEKRHVRIRKRNRVLLAFGIFAGIALMSTFTYLYFNVKSSAASYSILPGNVREFQLKYGELWVAGNTDIKISDDDSLIQLTKGEIFIKKKNGKNAITVNTPGKNRVIVFAGNLSVYSREELERITSLGDVTVFHDNDKVVLDYGQELRKDKKQVSIHRIQSPQYAGMFRYGKVVFENETLPFVLSKLSSFYNITIEFKDLPDVPRLSFIVSKDQDPAEAIKKILPLNWNIIKKEEKVYEITSKAIDGK
jgi:ferric-dicitrate binding protein FerR (iron transport regulator)